MKFSADVDALLLLVSCQDPGHKFGCNMAHAQFFRQNLLACPITNSHLLSNVVNGPMSILTDELLNSCNSFRSCAACGSPCAFVIVNWCVTGLEPGMPLKHLCTTQALVPEGLLNIEKWQKYSQNTTIWFNTTGMSHLKIIMRVSVALFPRLAKIGCTLAVPFSDPSRKSPKVTYTTPNKCVWKLCTSTQLHATWHTDSLDMVVLPSTGASRYQNCCIDGGTSLENFGYHLVYTLQVRMSTSGIVIHYKG